MQDSKPIPQVGDLIEATNFGIYRGRLGLRAPLSEVVQVLDDLSSPVSNILQLVDHDNKVFCASYSASQDEVYLSSFNYDGTSLTNHGVVWSSVTSKPTVTMASITGGTSTAGVNRLYIADYAANEVTRYWNGSTLTTLQADFNNDTTEADVKFSIVTNYQFHLWGTGWFQEGASSQRPEIWRFSQPGLVPGTDPAGGATQKEWFSDDWRPLGVRGKKATGVGFASGRMICFKANSTHTIFGFDSTSWSTQTLSQTVGAVGPHAVASVEDRACFFWSWNGPYMTDGINVQYIGKDVQQRVINMLPATGTDAVVTYSPDDGIVYFFVDSNSHHYLGYDTREARWLEGEYLTGAAAVLNVGCAVSIPYGTATPPAGAPSSLSATALDEDRISLTWSNGDTSLSTETHIHRGTSPGFTVQSSNLVATLGSGATSHIDTALAEQQTYYYKARHFRNGQYSSNSNEDSDKTWTNPPTNLWLEGIAGGIRVHMTNNSAGANIEIQRRVQGGGFSTVHTIVLPGTGATSWDNTGLTCGTLYFYRCRAVEAGETSSTYTGEANHIACQT